MSDKSDSISIFTGRYEVMKLVLIPAGTFKMGSGISPEEEAKIYQATADQFAESGYILASELPQHKVKITQPFYLQTTQVTQGQWTSLMGDNPSIHRDCGADCPVETVSWDDAQQFIEKLNQKENTDKYRLPTEAEWEYACRAGSTARFCFGDSDDQLREYAWYEANSSDYPNSGHGTHRVGWKKPNAWGLYDMHGNVLEWCQDWLDENYYSQSPKHDPKGPSSGEYHVLRGGSHLDFCSCLRSACRRGGGPVVRDYYDSRLGRGIYGFRVARTP